jgi:flagellar biogenesis protein FliO
MQAVTFLFAFVAVLALIGVVFWLLRRFAGNRLGTTANRGRMPRLAVIDAAAVDGRRRLVLVRRDNVEHLLMIGGPTDIVVESNIVRAMPAREQLPHRSPPVPAEPPPRLAPLPEAANWSDNDDAEPPIPAMPPLPPMPEPPPSRPARPAFAEELRRPPPMASERRIDPLAGFALEPLNRPEPRPEPPLRPEPPVRPEPPLRAAEQRGEPPLRGEPLSRPEPLPQRAEPMPPRAPARAEPMIPRAPRPSEAPKPSPLRAPAPERERAVAPPLPPSADQSLAEMAQRLEAALRRPPGEPPSPPVAPEPPPPPQPQRAAAPRSEPPPSVPAPAASPSSAFDSLEDEMASLLGRSKSSSS